MGQLSTRLLKLKLRLSPTKAEIAS